MGGVPRGICFALGGPNSYSTDSLVSPRTGICMFVALFLLASGIEITSDVDIVSCTVSAKAALVSIKYAVSRLNCLKIKRIVLAR